eukprot:TRINITY_DN4073_c0_g1_i1.p1 TRINITY_DN4073_c0_g1~~TRINITY_DN4073_c0_g1_i1.p1  ORF type:complete len:324 (-),score=52.27 TRINITY_DN4073_c0_g1_i1:74-961(-)
MATAAAACFGLRRIACASTSTAAAAAAAATCRQGAIGRLAAGSRTAPGCLLHGGWSGGLRARVSPWAATSARFFSEAARKTGTVKMWNEDKGFGFIAPDGGGDDVFVHRSALGQGVALSSGASVSFEAEWDDRKRKDRATNVEIDANAAAQAPSSTGGASGGASGGARAPVSAWHIVGAFEKWSIHRSPMSGDDSGSSTVRHRLTVRSDAPKASGDSRREEFQIVGNASWDHRLYPAGGDKEEVVVLKPGSAGSRAADLRGKGHGRNWAVEGKPGDKFDIIYDSESSMVSCKTSK